MLRRAVEHVTCVCDMLGRQVTAEVMARMHESQKLATLLQEKLTALNFAMSSSGEG